MGYYVDSASVTHGFVYAGGVYTTLDVPGSFFTYAYGINDAGQIVGFYGNSSGDYGFVYIGGVYTTLDVPGSAYTESYRINDAGQVVGTYRDSSGNHGFMATSVPEPSSLTLWAAAIVIGIAYDTHRRFRRVPALRPARQAG